MYELITELVYIKQINQRIPRFFVPFKEISAPLNESALVLDIQIVNSVGIPKNIEKKYDFRDGFYIHRDGTWFYKKNFFPNLTFEMSYKKIGNNIFIKANKLYKRIPFQIGNIYPLGIHITDLIFYELTLRGYMIFTGCGFFKDNYSEVYISPSSNGKSMMTLSKINSGYSNIGDDYIVMDVNLNLVYPIYTSYYGYKKSTAALTYKKIDKGNLWVSGKKKLNKLVFYANTSSELHEDWTFVMEDFIYTNSLHFLRNRFIRAVMMRDSAYGRIFNVVTEFSKRLETSEIVETCSKFIEE